MSTDVWTPFSLAGISGRDALLAAVAADLAPVDPDADADADADAFLPTRPVAVIAPARAASSSLAEGWAPRTPGWSFVPMTFPAVQGSTPGAEAVEQARVTGHAAGYAAGRREATAVLADDLTAQRATAGAAIDAESAALRSAADALVTAVRSAEEGAARIAEATDDALLAVALEIAVALLGSSLLEAEPKAVAAVRRALAAAGRAPIRAVRMHPDDVALIRANADLEHVPVVDDDAVVRGDALVDLEDRMIDARLATAVDRVRAALEADR